MRPRAGQWPRPPTFSTIMAVPAGRGGTSSESSQPSTASATCSGRRLARTVGKGPLRGEGLKRGVRPRGSGADRPHCPRAGSTAGIEAGSCC
jgi:hypothetical protein